MKKIKGLLVAGAAIASIGLSTQRVSASSGEIVDGNMREIVGVWVEVKGGGSGWAKLTPSKLHYKKTWSYDTKGRDYQLHVGVGGTPKNWGANIKSNWINGRRTITNVSTHWDYIWGNKIVIK